MHTTNAPQTVAARRTGGLPGRGLLALALAISGRLACHDLPDIEPADGRVSVDALPSGNVTLPAAQAAPVSQTAASGEGAPAAATLPVTVSGLVQGTQLALQVNGQTTQIGADGPTGVVFEGHPSDGLSVQVAVQPLGQTCVVGPGPSQVATASAGVTVTCRVSLRLAQGQAAAQVVGQASMTASASPGSPTANSLRLPRGGAVAPAGAALLFLADCTNNRVVGYPFPLADSNQAAALAVGQQDLASAASVGTTANTLNAPVSVDSDGSVLVVAEDYTNRVVVYPVVPGDSNAAATLAFGQHSLTAGHTNMACAPNALRSPGGAIMVDGALVVADTGNNRVLIWNSLPDSQADIPAPDVVVGQPNAYTCYNYNAYYSNTTSLLSPKGMYWDGSRFYLADDVGNRVLIWHGLPTGNVEANWVLGQPNLTSYAAGGGSGGLKAPQGIVADSQHIYVSDAGNHRIVAYDLGQLASGMAASYSLGQASLAQNAANRGGAVGPGGLYSPYGVGIAGVQLVVTDQQNNRLLLFDSGS